MSLAWKIGVLCAIIVIVNGQNPCDTDNGGCSDGCLFRGSGDAVCYCDCLAALDASDTQCVLETPCNIDMYALIDFSLFTDPRNCFFDSVFPGTVDWANWITWRDDYVGTFMSEFVADDAGSLWNVGMQLFSINGGITTANTYMSNNLSSGLADFQSNPTPHCQSTNFVRHLGRAVESSDDYTGPGTRRDATTTTRIAIIMVAGFVPINLATLPAIMEPIRAGFDSIIVIAKDTTSTDEEECNRFVACGNATAVTCDTLFYVDKVNDNGLSLTRANVESVINFDACAARQIVDIEPIISCGETMTIEIEKCALQGLEPADLVFLDETCNAGDSFVDNGGSYTITVDFLLCGVVTTTNGDVTYFQELTTRFYGATQDLPGVTFNLTCSYPRLTTTTAASGAVTTAVKSTSDIGFNDIDFEIFLDGSFDPPIEPGSIIEVNCPIFFQIEVDFPSTLTLFVYSCHVTPSSDPDADPSYYLANDACPVDPTFAFLAPPSSNVVRFTFTMLEFVSTYFEEQSEKLPVYVHCSLTACTAGDTSQQCDPVCPIMRRRRRDIDDGTTVTKSLGPFFIGPSKANKQVANDVKSNAVDETIPEATENLPVEDDFDRNVDVIYITEESPSKEIKFDGTFYAVVFFCLALIAFNYFGRKNSPKIISSVNSLPPKCSACCNQPKNEETKIPLPEYEA